MTRARILAGLLVLVLVAAGVAGVGARLERGGYRLAASLMPPAVPDARVVVVGIQRADLQRFGDWPWSRRVFADFINRVAAQHARVIALLPDFSTPQNAQALATLQALAGSDANVARALEALDTDRMLAASLKRAGNVVLSAYPTTETSQIPTLPERFGLSRSATQAAWVQWFGPPTTSVQIPVAMLTAGASGLGYVAALQPGPAQPLAVRVGDVVLPSLALTVAARTQGLSDRGIAWHAHGGVTLGTQVISTDAHLRVLARRTLRHGQPQVPVLDFSDVMDARVPTGALTGKAVLVGLTTQGVDSPVFVVADRVSGLLNGELVAAPLWANWLRGLLVLAVCLWLGWGLRRLSKIVAVSISVVLLVVLANLEFFPLLTQGLWLPLAYPLTLLVVGQLGWLAWLWLHARAGASGAAASEAHLQLAAAYRQLGRYDEAFDSLRRCLSSPVLYEAMQQLAQDHERHRRYADAIRVYEELQLRAPGFDDVTAHLDQLRQFETTPTLMGARRNGANNLMFTGGLQKPVLGRYQVVKEIGRGAMGVVYLGRDPKIGRTVAIKTMSLADEFDGKVLEEISQRFYREAETAGRLNHPNIVTIYDVGEDQGLAYIAMDFLPGEPLENFAEPGKLLSLAETVSITIKVAEALDYAHSQNVVHRDIKPANILYERQSGRLKITDFGIAALTDVSRTRTGTILGSPSYMSPEQIAGRRVDGRSDLYSLGVTFYQLLRGEVPFEAPSLTGLMYKIANEPHPDVTFLRPDIPALLKTVVDKALQKQAADRFQTGADMGKVLRACQAKLRLA